MSYLRVYQFRSLTFKSKSDSLQIIHHPQEVGKHPSSRKPCLPAVFSPHLREMIKVLVAGLGPHRHSVHFIVESVQEKAKELLSILLTEHKEERQRRLCTRPCACCRPAWRTCCGASLVANEAWCVSLDLGLELRRAHHVVGA